DDDDRAGGVLRWDGAGWQTIGEQGLSHRDVAAMTPYQGDVAVARRQDRLLRTTFFDFGLETPIVRRSGGEVTETLGTVDMNFGVPYVQKLLSDGDDLYVCGSFDQVDGLPVQNIARWDGSSWSDLGGGIGP